MPYIKKDQRPPVDALVDPVVAHIQKLPVEEQDGVLNYVITKMLKRVYPRKYFHLNRAMGMLASVMHEFYRRIGAPYEDTKIHENGDVD